ncbi:MAG: hypothetical protein ACRETL_16430 [Gammaproteobacteria bacterium]
MRTKKIFTPLAAAALAACATVSDSVADGSDVRLGQTAYIDGPKIRPIAVIEDSRCPMNARCVWAGQVRLKALWVRPSGNQEIELTLGKAKPLADGALTLTSVRPDKSTDRAIAPQDYRFSFSFAGGI